MLPVLSHNRFLPNAYILPRIVENRPGHYSFARSPAVTVAERNHSFTFTGSFRGRVHMERSTVLPVMQHNAPAFAEPALRSEAYSSAVAASGISWGAVIAGSFVAAALSLILLALGTGLGLSAVSPWSNLGASGAAIGRGAILWLILMEIMASSMGGGIWPVGCGRSGRESTQTRFIFVIRHTAFWPGALELLSRRHS
jgi:hypothetical protein